MTAASSYRGLMLTSIAGKAIRSAYREGMLNKYYCYTTEGHFSARARGNVGQAAFVLRLFLRYAKQAQLNCGIIFLDIQHAYYSVCRELASGFTGTDEQLCGIFKHFHLPQQAVHDLQRLISEGSAMDYAGCSDYHKSLLHGTWYRIRNSDKLTQTHGGSRPGDGLADLIFGYIFARMLESMRSEMIEVGIWDATSWKLGVDREQILCTGYKPDRIAANLEICWADDLALALHATSAESLLERIQAVGGFLLRWVKRFGMKPNLQRGKSETLLHLRGPGSKKIKTALFTPDDPTVDIIIDEEEAVQLRITHQYRHLGGQLHYVGNMVQEVRARCGMAKAAFADYKRKIFSNKFLSLKHHGQLLQCLIYSVLRWNYGAWPCLDEWAFRRYSSTTMILAKKICYANQRCDDVWTRSSRRILADLHVSSPQEALHVARLGFFTTAFHTAPDCLWTMAAAERSWINQIDEGLQWMWAQLQNTVTCSNFVDFVQSWTNQVATRQRTWRGWVKRAEQHAVLQRVNEELIVRWHSDFFDKLTAAGFQLPQVRNYITSKTPTGLHFCGPCKQVFQRKTDWAVHCFKMHNRTDPLRRFIVDGHCKACNGRYHTTRRLLAHLKYRRDCAVGHVFRQSKLEQLPPGRNAQTEDKDRPLPIPCQSGGRPQRPTEEMEKYYREVTTEDSFTPELCTLLRHCAEDLTMRPTDIAERIRRLILEQTQSSEATWLIVQTVHQQLVSQNLTTLGEAVHVVLENWTIDGLFGNEAKNVSFPKGWFETTSAETIKADVTRNLNSSCVKGPQINYIPRIHYKELLAVHFFSGTRREGDFQQWVSHIVAPAGLLITAISVDIIFDGKLGDLTNKDTQQRWISLALQGALAAVLLGPPCNTWSVSRWRSAYGLDSGPRPVRLLTCFFGMGSLSLREIRQVLLGNALLFFAFDMVYAMGIIQRVAILEHPDIPFREERAPTIWNTGAFQALKQIPGTKVISIHQGLFGAVSPKPTRLCITGDIEDCLDIFNRFSVYPMPPPMTMRKDGKQFATAQLKEYPSNLSAAMAGCVSSWLAREAKFFNPDATLEPSLAAQELAEPFRVDFSDLLTLGADTRGACDT